MGNSTLATLAHFTIDTQQSDNPIGPDWVVHGAALGPSIGAAAFVIRLIKDPKHIPNSSYIYNLCLFAIAIRPECCYAKFSCLISIQLRRNHSYSNRNRIVLL